MSGRPLFAVVLGAGLMGRLLAHELARTGHAVALYDAHGPDAVGAAARVAAAMLAPLAESAVTEPQVVRMGQHALQRWPQLIAALDGQPVFFQQEGTLVLWHRQDAAEARRFGQQLQATARALPELAAARPIDRAGIAALEPELAPRFAQGLYLPDEGQLDNRQLLDALRHRLERLDVPLHWHSPRAPQDFGAGGPGGPAWVLDCRGLGAQPQWPALRGVRGEVLRLHAPEVHLTRPVRLLHPRYPLYVAPKPGHLFVVGATEIEAQDFSPVSARSALELLSAAYSVHSGFAEARVIEMATQCRPALPDNLPALRRPAPRVLQVNGLYRHGFLIAPALLDAVLELLHTGASPTAERLQLAVETA